jgi:hypothetical protein
MPVVLTNQWDFFFFIFVKYTDNNQCTVTPIGISFSTVTPIGIYFRKVTPIGFNFRMDTPIGIKLRKDLYWHFITSWSRRTCILVQA